MPGGFVDGLHVELQLVAASGADVRLLALARVYERATGFAATAPEGRRDAPLADWPAWPVPTPT